MELETAFNKILKFFKTEGRSPSYAEVQKLMGYRSPNAASYLVKKLIAADLLSKSATGQIALRETSARIPFIGTMHAGKTVGFPNPSEEETSETMTLDELLTVDLYAAKLFRVRGDSMIEAGIFEDDILLVECTDKWKSGDIVIAEIDGEETVKYIHRGKNKKPFLRPANAELKDMHPEEYLKVKAVVKNVIRSYGSRN